MLVWQNDFFLLDRVVYLLQILPREVLALINATNISCKSIGGHPILRLYVWIVLVGVKHNSSVCQCVCCIFIGNVVRTIFNAELLRKHLHNTCYQLSLPGKTKSTEKFSQSFIKTFVMEVEQPNKGSE